MKKIILIAIVLAAVVAVVFYSRGNQQPPDTSLHISGNIEAHQSLVSFKVQGRIVDLPVQEGQYVKAGDVLARIDSDDYRRQVGVDAAQVHARTAELQLALAGSRPQEIKASEQTLRDAQADLELRKIELQRNQALHDKDEVSAETLDTVRTNLQRSQATYEHAKQVYDQIVEGTRKEQIEVNRANVHVAEQSLGVSQLKLDYTMLAAPTDGVVLVRQAEKGEVVAPGTPVCTVADVDHLWVRGYIAETDLGRVKWGQAATVQTDTFPGKTYRGRVSFISSEAEFTPKSVETHKERVTLVYRVKIDVENPNHELKPGMPADAVIETSLN
jgi:HlyD family secretion protein